jgi:hypothetical protein
VKTERAILNEKKEAVTIFLLLLFPFRLASNQVSSLLMPPYFHHPVHPMIACGYRRPTKSEPCQSNIETQQYPIKSLIHAHECDVEEICPHAGMKKISDDFTISTP